MQHAAPFSKSTIGAFALKTVLPSYSGSPLPQMPGFIHIGGQVDACT